jgi:amidohydrolase
MSTFDTIPATYSFPASFDREQLPEGFVDYLIALRRHLHRNPEIGYEEYATSRLVRNHLESHGLQVSGPHAQTGLFVDIDGEHPGPHIGFRCDLDALKLQDAKHVAYASRNTGVVHACGHDVHTTVGIGLALNLHQLRSHLRGRVRILFQPNEEGNPSGSVPMIEAGVCDPLKALYCIHVDPTLDIGQFGIPEGQVTASSDRLRVEVTAPSTGHSARPQNVKDTVWITTQLLNHYYQLIGRITDARNPAVFTVCILEAGQAHNVIPSKVSFEGALRSLNENDRVFLVNHMQRAAEKFAQLHEVKIDLINQGGLPAVINDPKLCQNARTCVHNLFGKDAALDICVPSMGAEDFANYLRHVPGMLIRVGTRGSTSTGYPLHDALFDIDERALSHSVRLMTRVLIHHTESGIFH